MILFFDTETTGFPSEDLSVKESGRLMQIAWIVGSKGQRFCERKYLVKPDGWNHVEEGAFKIHGITYEDCVRDGLPINEVFDILEKDVQFCHSAIAHNMQFDSRVVAKELLLSKHSLLSSWEGLKKYCSMIETRQLVGIRFKNGNFKNPSLQDLHKRLFGVGFEKGHDALVDTGKLFDCWYEIYKLKNGQNE